MSKRRVLIFSARKLFGESIEQTLSRVKDLEIAGHWPIDEQVLERLASACADFVVLTDEGASPEQLSHLTAAILDRYPDLPVFRVTLERSQMQVYSSHLAPASSTDLINLLHKLPVKKH
jgi:hypothetical protein